MKSETQTLMRIEEDESAGFGAGESNQGADAGVKRTGVENTPLPPTGGLPRQVPTSQSDDSSLHATILLIEDEQPLRELLSEVLEGAGYHVVAAADGRRAVELARDRRGPIDLVLTDIIMPEMGGLEAVRRIRDIRGDFQVMFMSGYPGKANDEDEVILERAVFLQKPVAPTHLLKAVRKILNS